MERFSRVLCGFQLSNNIANLPQQGHLQFFLNLEASSLRTEHVVLFMRVACPSPLATGQHHELVAWS